MSKKLQMNTIIPMLIYDVLKWIPQRYSVAQKRKIFLNSYRFMKWIFF